MRKEKKKQLLTPNFGMEGSVSIKFTSEDLPKIGTERMSDVFDDPKDEFEKVQKIPCWRETQSTTITTKKKD